MKLKENNKVNGAVYKYDVISDILGIKVDRSFEYDETVEMDDGILLDFDVDNIPPLWKFMMLPED